MGKEEPKIKILETGTVMPVEVEKRLDKIDTVLIAIVVAVVIALISITVAVFGIFLDQMRYSNVAYKEYSQKIESVEVTQKANEVLLKQIQELLEQSKQDREIIRQFLDK